MPAEALGNDLMIVYAPSILYEEKVTFMEMICASVCLTTMICFTLERKYRPAGRLFDVPVRMQRHAVGARGNATSFPCHGRKFCICCVRQMRAIMPVWCLICLAAEVS